MEAATVSPNNSLVKNEFKSLQEALERNLKRAFLKRVTNNTSHRTNPYTGNIFKALQLLPEALNSTCEESDQYLNGMCVLCVKTLVLCS